LPEAGARAAELVSERICRYLASEVEHPSLSVSAGAAVFPKDGMTIDDLLRTADAALYRMKFQKLQRPQPVMKEG
jgi:GGDEF domain-containing protein